VQLVAPNDDGDEVKLTDPEGVETPAGAESRTVAVQLTVPPTTTEVGEQLTLVEVTWVGNASSTSLLSVSAM
jgi:hypothetical protein